MNTITNEKMEINEIHKSVPIRDLDELWYCEARGGELKVRTKEGEGSKFIIELPKPKNEFIPKNECCHYRSFY